MLPRSVVSDVANLLSIGACETEEDCAAVCNTSKLSLLELLQRTRVHSPSKETKQV